MPFQDRRKSHEPCTSNTKILRNRIEILNLLIDYKLFRCDVVSNEITQSIETITELFRCFQLDRPDRSRQMARAARLIAVNGTM